jgi:hypothetical protein
MRSSREIGEIPFYGIRLRVPELQGASGEKDNSGSAREAPSVHLRSLLKGKNLSGRAGIRCV